LRATASRTGVDMSPRVLFATVQTIMRDSRMLSAFQPLRGTRTYTCKIVRWTNCRPPDFFVRPCGEIPLRAPLRLRKHSGLSRSG
jgi:hypothetical protein